MIDFRQTVSDYITNPDLDFINLSTNRLTDNIKYSKKYEVSYFRYPSNPVLFNLLKNNFLELSKLVDFKLDESDESVYFRNEYTTVDRLKENISLLTQLSSLATAELVWIDGKNYEYENTVKELKTEIRKKTLQTKKFIKDRCLHFEPIAQKTIEQIITNNLSHNLKTNAI